MLEFTPTFRNQSTSSESFISEIEIKKDSWQVVQHSFPPFIPVSQLVEDNSDLKVFIAALIDYGYAYVQRREALSFVKVCRNCICTQQRLRSACAFAQADQSICCLVE